MLVEAQKVQLGRIRPDEHPHLVTAYSLSFPSGHSANAMVTYVAMALILARTPGPRKPWMIAALLLTALIGISRVMLGVHWPSDVVAGWSFGFLWALLLAWLANRPAAPRRQTLNRNSSTSPS